MCYILSSSDSSSSFKDSCLKKESVIKEWSNSCFIIQPAINKMSFAAASHPSHCVQTPAVGRTAPISTFTFEGERPHLWQAQNEQFLRARTIPGLHCSLPCCPFPGTAATTEGMGVGMIHFPGSSTVCQRKH